jgi:hypothetical protein
MAELFDRPRCGLDARQLPVFAIIISLSHRSNRTMVALRRTPPDTTASA